MTFDQVSISIKDELTKGKAKLTAVEQACA